MLEFAGAERCQPVGWRALRRRRACCYGGLSDVVGHRVASHRCAGESTYRPFPLLHDRLRGGPCGHLPGRDPGEPPIGSKDTGRPCDRGSRTGSVLGEPSGQMRILACDLMAPSLTCRPVACQNSSGTKDAVRTRSPSVIGSRDVPVVIVFARERYGWT